MASGIPAAGEPSCRRRTRLDPLLFSPPPVVSLLAIRLSSGRRLDPVQPPVIRRGAQAISLRVLRSGQDHWIPSSSRELLPPRPITISKVSSLQPVAVLGMASKKKGRSYVKWTDQMDKAMLDVFVEHYNKGDRAQNGWKPHVYTAAVKNVREKCESEITKENIISRSKTFDKHYVVVNKMICQSGFGWDWENNMISVDSEDVWNNYVKANEDASSYRYKVIKYWDMISTLYSRDRATGAAARTAAESGAEMAEENANNNIKDANSSTQADEDRPKKRYRSDDSIATMLGDKLDNFTAAFKADVSEPPPKPASPEEIWAALGEIPDLEDDEQLAIYDVLVANDRKFKSFIALPQRMKK